MKRFFVAVLLIVVSVFALQSAASAELDLSPQSAHAGDVVDLDFHVVNDRADAFTKSLQIVFPASPTFSNAQASAPAGWSSSVDQLTGTVSSVTFDSGKLQGTDAGDFVITVAVPLHSPRVLFNVLQTFSDGQVVRWTQDPQTSKQDGGRLAPVLQVEGAITTTTAPSLTTTTLKSGQGAGKSGGSILGGPSLVGLGVVLLFYVTIRSRKKRGR